MFLGIGKKDEQKSNLWSDILITLVISNFVWTLTQKRMLPIPFLSVLVIAFICLLVLQWNPLRNLLEILAVIFFVLEIFFAGIPYWIGFLLLALIIFFARLFIPAIFSIFDK